MSEVKDLWKVRIGKNLPNVSPLKLVIYAGCLLLARKKTSLAEGLRESVANSLLAIGVTGGIRTRKFR